MYRLTPALLKNFIPRKVPKLKHPVSKAVSTMIVANTAQSEVILATKSRPQPKKEDTPSPSPLIEPPNPQTVSSKRSTNKNKAIRVGTKPEKRKTLSDREKRAIKTLLSLRTNTMSLGYSGWVLHGL